GFRCELVGSWPPPVPRHEPAEAARLIAEDFPAGRSGSTGPGPSIAGDLTRPDGNLTQAHLGLSRPDPDLARAQLPAPGGEWVCRSNPDTLAVQEFAPTQGLAPGSYDTRDLAAEAVKAVDATTQADPKRVLVELYAKPEPTPVPTAAFSCRRSMGPQRICDS